MKALAAVVLAAVLAACETSSSEEKLSVFAASSLTVAFQEIATRFETSHPEVEVVLSLAGSQTLATQIVNGAGADVFASADDEQMTRVSSAVPPDVGPVDFATNQLTIVVAEGNPHGVEGLGDLEQDDLVVVMGAEEVPVGRYARRMLASAGLEVTAASLEPNVGLVLTKVRLGEADAGVVYRSDLKRAGDGLEGVPIPSDLNVTAAYPIAGWEREGGKGRAREFIEYVTSVEGEDALAQAGFGG